jgi:hypothetical protein
LFPLLLSAPWWPVIKFAPDALADSWKPPDQTALNQVEAFMACQPVRVPRRMRGGRTCPEIRDWQLYADRRHRWFTVGPDDVTTAEA